MSAYHHENVIFEKLKAHLGHAIHLSHHDSLLGPLMVIGCRDCGLPIFEFNADKKPICKGEVAEGDSVYFEDSSNPDQRFAAQFLGFEGEGTVTVLWNQGRLSLARTRVFKSEVIPSAHQDKRILQSSLVKDLSDALDYAVLKVITSGGGENPVTADWLDFAKKVLKRAGHEVWQKTDG
ncbi:hypothetical protein [Desulfuromonas sp. AOP6]|uniref:hypothetical protein n=1 Tax=Desulfuromonas sp. AOP6 TaxID=1566351 RepID=UPI00128586CC|nr:hypothetical protein [Desulfuromonas sp. AOP6]BCA79293.1 hypothetical protein AOP6_1080 [Desulfuromonas sp. AOP6]